MKKKLCITFLDDECPYSQPPFFQKQKKLIKNSRPICDDILQSIFKDRNASILSLLIVFFSNPILTTFVNLLISLSDD